MEEEREVLKREQQSHSNTIEELLRRRHGDPCPSDYLDWLAQQRDWEGNRVPPRLLAEITREHARLRLVMEQLAELEE